MKKTAKAQNNYIYEYYQGIKDGSIVVGRWIALLYEKIIAGLEEKAYIYDAKKANKAIEWIEAHCFHCEGPLAPRPLKLELWQKAFLACVFGLCDPKTGYRQFREVVLVVARKNGKSILASGIGKYEWKIDGGFGSRVFCISPKLDQADILYNDIWQMCLLDPEYQRQKADLEADKKARIRTDDPDMERHRMTDLYIPGTNSMVKKIAFSAKKSDGFNPSLTICDEIASWQGDAGLKQYEVMKSGMGARPEALLLSCSTSGYVNDGIYDELVKRATSFLLGNSKESRLLPFLYMIDDVEKWNDINELRKSNPNLGVSVSVDYLLEEIAIAEGSLSKRAEFLTKYANIKQNSSQAWLDFKIVDKAFCDPLRLEDFKGSYCVGGIDLSQTTDLTSACIVVERQGALFVFPKFWMPASRLQNAIAEDGVPYNIFLQQGILELSGENYVDYNDCFNWFRQLVEKYEIYPLQVGYDRFSAQYLVEQMKQYGFHMDDVFQGPNLTPVIREVDGLLKDGVFRIGHNNLMKSHMLNSALKADTESQKVKLVKVGNRKRIDGMAALLDAMTVRQKWWNEIGQQLRNEG